MNGKLSVHVPNALDGTGVSFDAVYAFESMTHARVIQRQENTFAASPSKPFVAPNYPTTVGPAALPSSGFGSGECSTAVVGGWTRPLV